MHLIEVFTEDGCESCERVIELVQSFTGVPDLMVRVYERAADTYMFNARGVAICPATCIDGTLAFYGEYSADELQEFFLKKEEPQRAIHTPIAKQTSNQKPSWLQLVRNIIGGILVIVTLVSFDILCSKQPSNFTAGGTVLPYSTGSGLQDELE